MPESNAKASSRPSRRAYLLITLFAFALVLLPFLFWYDTWFGRRLTDAQIEKYLRPDDKPRRAQQALVQIGERMSRGDPGARQWYPRIIALASHPAAEMRMTAAWIMGQDPRHAAFREPLHRLFADRSALVRRNASLALAAFGDPAGRVELRAMLRSHVLESPRDGTVKYRLKAGDYVNPGTLVARVGGAELRAELPGELRRRLQPDGARVAPGAPLAEFSPDDAHAWEALRALYLVGGRDDLEEVQRWARGGPKGSEKLRRQSEATARRIASRSP